MRYPRRSLGHLVPLAGIALLLFTSYTSVAAVPEAGPLSPDGDSQKLEEIVVTAQKREENIQKTPIAITAFTSGDIKAHSLENLLDIKATTPSLNFETASYDPFSAFITLRGQSATDVLLESESPVGIYVDGVYQNTMQGVQADSLIGVERIEVLKGPQGTLYGRNTTGGAINVVTSQPDYDGIHGSAQLGGGDYQTGRAGADVNIPIVDQLLSARASAQYFIQHQGFGRDVTNGTDLEAERTETARLALRLDAASNLDFTLRADYAYGHSTGTLNRLVAVKVGSPANIETSLEQALAGKLISGGANISGPWLGALGPVLSGAGSPAQQQVFGAGLVAGAAGLLGQIPTDGYKTALTLGVSDHSTVEQGGLSLTGNWRIAEGLSFKSISSFRRISKDYPIDSDGSPASIITPLATTLHSNQWTQEFNLNGDTLGQRLKYLLGFFYFNTTGRDLQASSVLTDLLGGLAASTSATDALVTDKSTAGFGQATYTLLDGLNLTGGLRYTTETKDLRSRSTAPGGACNTALVNGRCDTPFSNRFSNTSFTAGLDYSLSDSTLVYAKSASGYKAGGQNERVNTTNAEFANFAPEKVINYEVGFKADFLQRRLRFNTAIYYTDYTDIQLTEVVPSGNNTVTSIIANAGAATIKGAEIEIHALPIDSLLVGVTYSYTDPHFTKGEPAFSGDRFQGVAKQQGSVSVIYTLPTVMGEAKVGVDYTWQSLVDYQAYNHDGVTPASLTQQPGFGLLNARLSLDFQRINTTVAAYGKNLADRYYISGGLDIAGPLGTVTQFVGNPRTFGLEVQHRF